MKVLRLLPTDGTFDQLKPLRRLKGFKNLYSYDRRYWFPSCYGISWGLNITGSQFGATWKINIILWTGLTFRVAKDSRLPYEEQKKEVAFTKGQPLGFASSWPVFTLTHHLIVWFAAHRVRPGIPFWDYAIFGDDLLIADSKVLSMPI